MQAAKKLFLTPLILILLMAAYLSVRWAIADIFETQIRYQLGKAQTDGQTLDAQQWRLTHNMLQTTLKLHPDYSGYLELAEFVYQVAASRPQALIDELGCHDSQQQALEYTRRALLKRPTWPYLWDELFQNKIKLKQFDNELTGAMERAFTGLDYWDNLSTTAQQTVAKAMEQTLAMKKYPKSLYKDMQGQANIGKLCQRITESDHTLNLLGQFCQQNNSVIH